MANTAGRRDVLKDSAFCVAKHPLGHQGPIVWTAGSQVDVRPTVVVDVSEVAPRSIEDLIEPDFPGYIGKACAPLVSIQARQFCCERQAQVTGSHLTRSVSTTG